MTAQINRTRAAMLKSMAASLRSGMGFSFNPIDMADLLDDLAQKIEPKPFIYPVPKTYPTPETIQINGHQYDLRIEG